MRLSHQHIQLIQQSVSELTDPAARVRLFGSRLDDNKRGGDIDLLVELPHPPSNPALLTAQLTANIRIKLKGRSVDVLLSAPNLKTLPIHQIAQTQGVYLW